MHHSADGARRAAIFDLDGTLVDTKRLYLECYRRAVEPRLRRAPDDTEILSHKPRSELRFLEAVVGADQMRACLLDFYQHYQQLHESHFDGVYAGVGDVLQRLRERGVALGVVTGKSRRSWQITAPIAGLGEFDTLVMDDDVDAPKPDPHGIRLALASLKVDRSRAVYVGDTASDMIAARDAGVQPIAALWGRGESAARFAERAEAEGAWIAERPGQLVAAIDRLTRDPVPGSR